MDKKISQLEIARMPEGGYAVCDGHVFTDGANRGFSVPWPRFASTTIDECLAYIKRQIEPESIS